MANTTRRKFLMLPGVKSTIGPANAVASETETVRNQRVCRFADGKPERVGDG